MALQLVNKKIPDRDSRGNPAKQIGTYSPGGRHQRG
jgi:hypothetical protein